MATTAYFILEQSRHFSVLDLNISYDHQAQAKVNLPLLNFLAARIVILIITILSLSPFSFIWLSLVATPPVAQLRSFNGWPSRPWYNSCDSNNTPELKRPRRNTVSRLSRALPVRCGQHCRIYRWRKLRKAGIRAVGGGYKRYTIRYLR